MTPHRSSLYCPHGSVEELRYLVLAAQRDGNRMLAALLQPARADARAGRGPRPCSRRADRPLTVSQDRRPAVCEPGSPSRLVTSLVAAGYVAEARSGRPPRLRRSTLDRAGRAGGRAAVREVEERFHDELRRRLDLCSGDDRSCDARPAPDRPGGASGRRARAPASLEPLAEAQAGLREPERARTRLRVRAAARPRSRGGRAPPPRERPPRRLPAARGRCRARVRPSPDHEGDRPGRAARRARGRCGRRARPGLRPRRSSATNTVVALRAAAPAGAASAVGSHRVAELAEQPARCAGTSSGAGGRTLITVVRSARSRAWRRSPGRRPTSEATMPIVNASATTASDATGPTLYASSSSSLTATSASTTAIVSSR